MNTQLEKAIDPQTFPFGLFELDADWTVLYYKPDIRETSGNGDSEFVGRNLLTEVPALALSREFQDRLNDFRKSHAPADSFHYTFSSERGQIQVKILLARLHERSGLDSTESILLHIREA
jgi:hypothetical protein